MQLLVPFMGPSTNDIYSGIHFRERMKHKGQALIALARLGHIQPFSGPVNIEVTPQLGKGKRTYDVSNYSYTYKLIEDALVTKQILIDDTPQYVQSVKFNCPVRTGEFSSAMLIKIEVVNG